MRGAGDDDDDFNTSVHFFVYFEIDCHLTRTNLRQNKTNKIRTHTQAQKAIHMYC
jgi:hypothetical protein